MKTEALATIDALIAQHREALENPDNAAHAPFFAASIRALENIRNSIVAMTQGLPRAHIN